MDTENTASLSKQRCDRKIYSNKYERNAPEIRHWWYELFDLLEADASIPPDERIEILTEVLPSWILGRIIRILSTQNRKFLEELEHAETSDVEKLFLKPKVRAKKSESSVTSNRSVIATEERIGCQQEFVSKESTDMFQKIMVEGKIEVPKTKMYTEFYKRNPSRAAVWRTLPPLSLEEMNLNQKAVAIAEQIARNYVDWLNTIGGEDDTPISIQSVIELFEIGFSAHSTTTLKVDLKEMPSLPQKVADARGMPHLAKRAMLRKEIERDHKATKQKTRLAAFGRRLPTDMQVKPPRASSIEKWLRCETVPVHLQTMSAVWEGITNLKSTRAFCEYLIDKPNVTFPKYLVDCGMTNRKLLHAEAMKAALKDKEDQLYQRFNKN